MELNIGTKNLRKYICIQIPEEIDIKNKKQKEAYEFCQALNIPQTIAEIAKERIRRAGRQIQENLPTDTLLDTGFKVFKQGASNFNDWKLARPTKIPQFYVDTIKQNSNKVNILYELMLRFGLPLTCPVNFDADREIYWVENEHNQRFAFLLSRATPEIIDHLCRQRPDKVVALDRHFSDELKINSALRFKEAGIGYEWL